MQEPTQPNTLSFSFQADPVHAVVPISSAHQRKAMTSGIQAAIERSRAVFEQTRAICGTIRLKIRFQLSMTEFIAFKKRNHFIQNFCVSRRLNKMNYGVR